MQTAPTRIFSKDEVLPFRQFPYCHIPPGLCPGVLRLRVRSQANPTASLSTAFQAGLNYKYREVMAIHAEASVTCHVRGDRRNAIHTEASVT